MRLKGLYKSTRMEITIAFVVPVIMIAVASAITTGNLITWYNIIPGAGVLFCFVLISNILNNVVDKDIDTIAYNNHNAKSEMYHPLVTKQISAYSSLLLLIFSCILLLLFSEWLILTTGKIAGILIFIGLFFAVQYNLPPFKLAYHPFPELTMLLPATIVAVAGIQYILVQEVTIVGVFVSASFGMFSACWFFAQSAVDIRTDNEVGKITTPVYVGMDLRLVVVGLYCIAAVIVPFMGIDAGLSSFHTVISFICAVHLFLYWINEDDLMNVWKRSMQVSFINGLVSALIIVLGVV